MILLLVVFGCLDKSNRTSGGLRSHRGGGGGQGVFEEGTENYIAGEGRVEVLI